MTPLLSHEIPTQLFPYHDFINDYPYLLGHLLNKNSSAYNEQYANFYKEAVRRHSYSILDNSAFELGDSIDPSTLFQLGEEYLPTHIILPDKLHDMEVTKRRCMEYILEFGKRSTPKLMAVLQGSTFQELFELYDFYNALSEIDIVAIPFDALPDSGVVPGHNPKLVRVDVIERMNALTNIFSKKKLHLLGCATPQEFSFYRAISIKERIHSIDTSAPIIYGWNKIKFSELTPALLPNDVSKPKDKLAENLDIELSTEQLQVIAHNVKAFRKVFTC